MSRRFSIAALIPVYNQRATIVQAIQTVLDQTRQADEIIVIDDGSTDGSGELVREMFGSRVRLIRQENQGAPGAFNAGIRASKSDLVSLLGADDGWMPNRLEKQVAFMEAHPDCMMSFPAAEMRDEIHNKRYIEGATLDKRTFITRQFFREEHLLAGNGVMVRREVFDELGYFDPALRRCQDTDMWLRIMMRYGFEHIPEPLVWVRRGKHRTQSSDLSTGFGYHDLYYHKHRYTFGRGLNGQYTWRTAYSGALRMHAIWYFQHGPMRKALRDLGRAIFVWPFFNPSWVLKAALERLLGQASYARATWLFRKFRPRRSAEPSQPG